MEHESPTLTGRVVNCLDCLKKDREIGKLNEELSDLKNSLPVLKRMSGKWEAHPVGITCVGSSD